MTDTFTIAIEGTGQGQHLLKLARELRRQMDHHLLDARLVAEMISVIDGLAPPPLPDLPRLCAIQSVDNDC